MAKTYTREQLQHGKLYRAIDGETGAKIVGIQEIVYCRQHVSCFFKGDAKVPLQVEYSDNADLTDGEAATENGETIYLDTAWKTYPESRLVFVEIDEDGNDVP